MGMGAFLLFSQNIPSQNLGFIDSKATTLELTINGQDLTITQSPGVLSSNRAGGTTGAVVWKVTPPFASWLASPETNIFFKSGVLSPTSTVLELGCGVSALVGLAVGPLVSRYVLTDQPYVARFVQQNIQQNQHPPRPSARPSSNRRKGKDNHGSGSNSRHHTQTPPGTGNIIFNPLDWELDTPTPALVGPDPDASSFDFLVACDCIYNEALVPHLTQTCADLCRLRSSDARSEGRPCVCVVAQQLRDPEVFEAWLRDFCAKGFRVWRVPDRELPKALRSSSGFVVHVGILQG
ncbi:Diaminohydroxyphosphoribosylamino-pyrimidine deaminase [Cytospora mali]|uniref:Diaminohydroxyphosphoribosylamino-pyrimidine deaminase n=1 Tax=Cytospora mali TaxID=578113 RepID=A0A194UQ13_CYTMA|nr:Diaminohydroxyphosphoribosylamino-pyrimidine deaminase [Valsa mali var. pyri (nom. inval.)]